MQTLREVIDRRPITVFTVINGRIRLDKILVQDPPVKRDDTLAQAAITAAGGLS